MKKSRFIRKITAAIAGLALLAGPVAAATSSDVALFRPMYSKAAFSEGPWGI